ncbi:MAG: peptidoglycan-binding domain-containing protein, partial [bacterium]
ISGIFGPRTQYAVELVQMDLNLPVTGVADSDLQRRLLNGEIPKYDAFMALTRGNRGMRVQIMQETLRELGYLADAADGIFGANTQRAVQRFQAENDLNISDGATRETLKRLYSDDAARCSSFIDLYRGNTGYRVRELNNRLEALYYLEDNPGSTYTAATAEAVRAFQRRAGLDVNGNATESVQRRLFSRYAPEAPGYITLRRGDENSRVSDLQIRLKDLGYFTGNISGYYGSTTEKAVKLFQRRVELSVTGVATVRTQQLLFRRDAPKYVEPTVISDPVITVDPYTYRDGGIYYITDDTAWRGNVAFNWYVEGEVESFRVNIKDSAGHRVFEDSTLLTRTGVAIATLDYDDVYTMTVTAYPEDGDSKHITSAKLRFCRVKMPEVPVIPVVGEVGIPEIRLETVTRVQGGVQYVDTGRIVMRWRAIGELDHYE